MEDVFCKIIAGEIPSNTCYEDEYVKCIMDADPETPGHTLIIPKKHYSTILDMDKEMIVHIHETAQMLIKRMEERIPDVEGVTSLVNYGSMQAVKHYHLHLIPIYKGMDASMVKEVSDAVKRKINIPNKSQEEICELLK